MGTPFRTRANTWPRPRPDDSHDILCSDQLEPCPEVLGSCSSFGTLVGEDGDLADGLRNITSSGSQHQLLSELPSTHTLLQPAQTISQSDQLRSDSHSPNDALSSSGERINEGCLAELSELAELDELGQLPNDVSGGVPGGPEVPNGQQLSPQSAQKKNSSRRNAWGNMSYADLITQAIQESSEKRLTLSQIYEWMVRNVSYFKDKGDSNSSAGWKVSECSSFFFYSLLFINYDRDLTLPNKFFG